MLAAALALMAALELRPAPRVGAALEHSFAGGTRLEESLSAGLGSFPDFELRTSLVWELLDPVRPWIAWQLRGIDLEGLPPVENHLSAGLGFTSDTGRRISLAAGVGARFQVPPLAAEPAGDAATYFAENVSALVFFALRVRLW